MSLPTSIPLKRDPPADVAAGAAGMDFGGMAGLGLLLIVAVFAWAWWRRRTAGGQAAATASTATSKSPPWAQWLGAARTRAGITTLASSRLTPRHSVHEVQWQGKRLLIGCAEHSICLLAEAPLADAPVDTPAKADTPAPGES